MSNLTTWTTCYSLEVNLITPAVHTVPVWMGSCLLRHTTVSYGISQSTGVVGGWMHLELCCLPTCHCFHPLRVCSPREHEVPDDTAQNVLENMSTLEQCFPEASTDAGLLTRLKSPTDALHVIDATYHRIWEDPVLANFFYGTTNPRQFMAMRVCALRASTWRRAPQARVSRECAGLHAAHMRRCCHVPLPHVRRGGARRADIAGCCVHERSRGR